MNSAIDIEKVLDLKNITFKKAAAEDAELCLSLEISMAGTKTYASLASIAQVLEDLKEKVAYLVEINNSTVGTFKYKITGNEAQISRVIVLPPFQGKGIGREAMNFALSELSNKQGLQSVWLVTHPHNTKAIVLYLSLGFYIESWKDNYYGNEPRIILRLKLN